jgi:predicted RNA binding protein YcfA (HicA-like mRNA interferase family)
VATFGDLKRFVENDGWDLEPNLVRGGRRGGDHDRYRKPQPSGVPLRTKVSRHPREEIGPDLFRRILHDQLRVTEERLWAVVRGQSQAPEADASPPSEPGKPGWLVMRLIRTAGLSEDEISRMTTDEALTAWEAFRSRVR